MEPVKGEPWPVNRCTHSACCLNYGGNHPQLLVYGGMGCSENILKDMWVLDVDSGKWTEVSMSQFLNIFICMHHSHADSVYFHSIQITLPESMKPRRNHSLTATSLGPGLTEVLLIGGKQTWLKSSIAKTTIFRFGE